MNPVFTIGHSSHEILKFTEILKDNNVEVVVDVRSSPYSKYHPQFNQKPLKQKLNESNIKYLFLGKELGARSDDPACYVNGKVSFDKLSQSPLFQEGISRVIKGASKFRIALMCAEKDPLDCHRTILVARNLAKNSIEINHILFDGTVESGASASLRLRALYNLDTPNMFESEEEQENKAYEKQEAKVAYVKNEENNV